MTINTVPAYHDPAFPAYFPEELVSRAHTRILRRGESLFSYGERIGSLFRVVEGHVSLVHLMPDGGSLVLMRAGPGEFIAECSVCADKYTCEARAESESIVASLAIADFDRWLIEDNCFARAWAMDLARRLKDQFLRYERLGLRGARERVLHYLYSEADPRGTLTLTCSYTDWAADLGLTKEAMYRTLSTLENEGVLTREGRCMTINRPRA
ncbi:MAG: Crp/Fnr family transcriptional regulator [Thioalkalivibrio sp.]